MKWNKTILITLLLGIMILPIFSFGEVFQLEKINKENLNSDFVSEGDTVTGSAIAGQFSTNIFEKIGTHLSQFLNGVLLTQAGLFIILAFFLGSITKFFVVPNIWSDSSKKAQSVIGLFTGIVLTLVLFVGFKEPIREFFEYGFETYPGFIVIAMGLLLFLCLVILRKLIKATMDDDQAAVWTRIIGSILIIFYCIYVLSNYGSSENIASLMIVLLFVAIIYLIFTLVTQWGFLFTIVRSDSYYDRLNKFNEQTENMMKYEHNKEKLKKIKADRKLINNLTSLGAEILGVKSLKKIDTKMYKKEIRITDVVGKAWKTDKLNNLINKIDDGDEKAKTRYKKNADKALARFGEWLEKITIYKNTRGNPSTLSQLDRTYLSDTNRLAQKYFRYWVDDSITTKTSNGFMDKRKELVNKVRNIKELIALDIRELMGNLTIENVTLNTNLVRFVLSYDLNNYGIDGTNRTIKLTYVEKDADRSGMRNLKYRDVKGDDTLLILGKNKPAPFKNLVRSNHGRGAQYTLSIKAIKPITFITNRDSKVFGNNPSPTDEGQSYPETISNMAMQFEKETYSIMGDIVPNPHLFYQLIKMYYYADDSSTDDATLEGIYNTIHGGGNEYDTLKNDKQFTNLSGDKSTLTNHRDKLKFLALKHLRALKLEIN